LEAHRIADRLCLLAGLDSAPKPLGKTHLTKLLFKVELDLRDGGEGPSPGYTFVRWNYGPYSGEMLRDVATLRVNGLVAGKESAAHLSQRGKALVEWARGRLQANAEWRHALEVLRRDARFVASQTATGISDWSHKLRMRPDGAAKVVLVDDMEMTTPILVPSERPSWRPLPLDPELAAALRHAMELTDAEVAGMRMSRPVDLAQLLD
jgi:hypothetical protein